MSRSRTLTVIAGVLAFAAVAAVFLVAVLALIELVEALLWFFGLALTGTPTPL